ncbi:serine protease [Thalassotalea ponticola]|uniref:S1 family peptidase n=1 Tax=Thalassotalea ponticola TaxID=1523392 RepID=UPI0025B58218|nr:serine protease [Thalassotalea ponticola]MDN3652409.1 serine protease [Thalassotalea ponticola]
MMSLMVRALQLGICLIWLTSSFALASQSLVKQIKRIKPSIVGVGIYEPTGAPQSRLYGTGFVIGNGSYVVTNYHVLRAELTDTQQRVVFSGTGPRSQVHKVDIVAYSSETDLAILKLQQGQLPALTLSQDLAVNEGQDIAFTGFPIGAVLGLYPVTHQGIVASITPDAIPLVGDKQLSAAMIKRLKNPKLIYQLDATAYPGNSGSPVYFPESGVVVAVINKVLVQSGKESVISAPSGITYAIPIKHVFSLLASQGIDINAP